MGRITSSVKSHIVNILDFAGDKVSAVTPELCYYSVEVATTLCK